MGFLYRTWSKRTRFFLSNLVRIVLVVYVPVSYIVCCLFVSPSFLLCMRSNIMAIRCFSALLLPTFILTLLSLFSLVNTRLLCELCISGNVCFKGASPPTSGVCTYTCTQCRERGMQCQTCANTCRSVFNTLPSVSCSSNQQCCGSFSGLTRCNYGDCCITKGNLCTSAKEKCCVGMTCSDITGRCVFGGGSMTSTSTIEPQETCPANPDVPINSCECRLAFITNENRSYTKTIQGLLESLERCLKNSRLGSELDNDTLFSTPTTLDLIVPITGGNPSRLFGQGLIEQTVHLP